VIAVQCREMVVDSKDEKTENISRWKFHGKQVDKEKFVENVGSKFGLKK
jgi:hypothetical protein